MPTTPNGVSKYLAHHGFTRAAWINQANGPGMWTEGFHVELAEDDEIVVWYYGSQPLTNLLELATSLKEGGYEIQVDRVTRAILVEDRDEDWSLD